MNREALMGIFWNIVVGIIGSVLGNFIAGFASVTGPIQEFSVVGLTVAFLGVVVLLGIVNMFQRGSVR